jgi:hypothetical protein
VSGRLVGWVILFVAAALYVAALRGGAAVGGPSRGWRAFFYFALFFGLGTAAILQAFGIIEGRR